jgi:predicted trehalose synthase
MIFFVCLHTNVQVHVQALGFTNMVMFFAEADTDDQAGAKARAYFESKYKIGTRVSSVSLALRQDRRRYCFPESIL